MAEFVLFHQVLGLTPGVVYAEGIGPSWLATNCPVAVGGP